MESIKLNGCWKLHYFPQEDSEVTCPDDLERFKIQSIEASVPGNVEIELQKVGKLPQDLYYGNNVNAVREYELHEWWYQTEFKTPKCTVSQKVELIFHGVDCLATYWLNGNEIGKTANMLIEHRFDITRYINHNGMNVLTIRLQSPVLEALSKEYDVSMIAFPKNFEGIWIRKAPHMFGWDIMPRAVSAGLWRDVELVVHEKNEIADLYFYTFSIDGEKVRIGVYCQLDIEAKKIPDLQIRFKGQCGDSHFESTRKVHFKAEWIYIDIVDTRLWWPKGYGEASLYSVTAELLFDNQVVDTRKDTIGVRTVELLRTEITSTDNPGQFMFKVNNVPILCKGSNWVPADVFHSRDKAKYEKLLGLFNDLNCNMLRCWGGNVYEDHEFFDICDTHGIMVWQDFAMACASYPNDNEFLEVMRQEATSIVRKLRNHPSIVVWCGDNECDQFRIRKNLMPSNNRITREVLPQVVAKCDPHRAYLPGSPYFSKQAEDAKDFNMLPEQHLWGPRDSFKSRYYAEATAHFVGETGYQGCPNLESIKKFIDEEHIWPWQNNEQWITHATEPTGKDGLFAFRIKLMADQICEFFGFNPDNIEDFIVASQISQAEANKFYIELTRLKKWRRTGILWWNVIDGWPQFSDAVVDYYSCKKLAYHYTKRLQQPVCIMVSEPENWNVKVVAGNDSNNDANGSYRVWDADTGETLLEGEFYTKANENSELGSIRVSNGIHRLLLIEWTMDGKKYGNHYLSGHPPFSLEKYKSWIKKIAELEFGFDAQEYI